MIKLALLYLTFLVSCVFLILPKIGPQDYFLFSDQQLYFATYVYFIVERMALIILAYIILMDAKDHRGAISIFFCLLILDLADFLLCYNSVWFEFQGLPMSMNIFKTTVFGLVILNEIWTHQLAKR